MPKITEYEGPSNRFEDDGARVDVQEPILPQEDPSLDGKFHAERNKVEGSEESGYSEFSKDDLLAEIKRRNESREEADRLSVTGNKPDLLAALEDDDKQQAAKSNTENSPKE